MALINLTTNFRSLKFGGDRPGGGSSKQPFIKNPIPNNWNDSGPSNVFNTGGDDNFVRGGLMTPLRIADDTSRLTQLFFTTTKGTLFTAKQNLLSRISVETEASKGPGYAGKALNQGAYTPLSTLGQAAVGFSGTHLNTFGLDPSSPMTGVVDGGLLPGLGLNRYEEIVSKNNSEGENRLEKYLNTYINNKTPEIFFPEQSGGPGSILGVGKTKIPLSTQRTGVNRKEVFKEGGIGIPKHDNATLGKIIFFNNDFEDKNDPNKLTSPSRFLLSQKVTGLSNFSGKSLGINVDQNPKSVYINSIKFGDKNSDALESNLSLFQEIEGIGNGVSTFSQTQIINYNSDDLYHQKEEIKDFRKELKENDSILPSSNPSNKKILGKLNDGYNSDIRMENRVNSGDPGKRKDVTKYGGKVSAKDAIDKITASPIVSRSNPYHGGDLNDLVKFSIGIIKNDSSGESYFMNFRSFINSFSDAYSADWGSTQYVGRADKFYNYKGFDRTISMGFTIAAQSKAELIPMYKKLNFLASSLAPTYSGAGFMQGNLVRLTVGGYLYNQVGIIKGLTYDIPSESPWEIGINDSGGFDNSVKEMPHIINVTGFQFIPIHNFVARRSDPNNQKPTRYISLANGSGGSNSNY